MTAAVLLPQLAAANTLYVLNGTAAGSNFGALQDGGTAPGTATTSTGWTTGQGTVGNMSPMDWGVKQLRNSFGTAVVPNGTPSNATGDSLRTQNTYNGTFANATWTIRIALRATVANTNRFRLRCRVLAATDPTGATNLRELTAGTALLGAATTANISTTANTPLTVSWTNPGAITLTDEYLFFQIALEFTTAGSTGNTQDAMIWTDASSSIVTTPAFTAAVPVATLTLNPTSATITAGATQTIAATTGPSNAANRAVSWSKGAGCDASDSVSPATTDGLGTSTTFTAGTTGTFPRACAVVATAADGSGVSQTATITIDAQPVTSVSLSPTNASINAGQTQTIAATTGPTTAANRAVDWSKGDGCDASDSVSPTSTSGLGTSTTFTAGTAGSFPRSCVVTATAADGGGASQTATITVTPQPVTSISLSPTTAAINAGQTQTIAATSGPTTATNRAVSWSKGAGCDASDSVSPTSTDGLGTSTTFTAGATGSFPRSCGVTATAADGSAVFQTATITISPEPVATITLNPMTATIGAGGTQAIAATSGPATAANRAVNWSKGAGCDASDSLSPPTTNGLGTSTTFTAGTGGTFPRSCAVTATAADGGGASQIATIAIDAQLVTTITLDPTSATIVADGTQAIAATSGPATAANRALSWSKGAGCDGSDAISPTSTNGLGTTTTFTAGSAGTFPRTCTVTATAADGGGRSATASMTISATPVASVSVSPGTATVLAGGTQALSATANPSNATNRNVTWTKVSGCAAGDTLSPASTLGDGSATTTFTASATGTFPRSCVVRATALDGSSAYGQSTITVNPIAVTSVAIAPPSATVNTGATQQLTATVSPANATNLAVTWSVVQGVTCGTVSSTGLYTAPANVTTPCTVRVTTADGSKTANAAITLRKPVTSVAIAPTSAALATGATRQFTATVTPSDATNKSVLWSVLGGSTCGAVTATGLYTAPAAIASGCGVRATAADNGALYSDAAVTITAPPQTTVADVADPPSGIVAPGSAARALDAFSLQTNLGTDAVTSATVSLATSTWSTLSRISIQNVLACNGTSLGSAVPGNDTVTIPLSGLTATASIATYYVCITPKPHADVASPPGATYAVTGRVTAIASTNPKAYSNGSGATITIDNKSPANAVWGAITPGDRQVQLTWTRPADSDYAQVVVLRNAGAPVVDAPAEGQDYAANDPLPNSRVVCAQASGPCTDGGLTNGVAYYYKAFAKDQNGNYALGIAAGPAFPGANPLPVGSSSPTAVAVAIVNPGNGSVVGSVTASFRVQVRAWSPGAAIGGVQVTTSAGGSWTALAKSAAYGGDVRSGVWEGQLTRGAASYTIVARAHNSAAGCDPDGTLTPGNTADDCAWVNSAPVGVVVNAVSIGDGRLLVRDNASQLCTDCHAMRSHSSEALGPTYGSWATVCRDCHTPHGTTNLDLVATQITPPPRGASVPSPKPVAFTDRTALVNGSNNGPCQVCHTQTAFYRADGAGGEHETGNDCAKCHNHNQGLAATCTDCHGTKDRPKAPGVGAVDTNYAAAPPRDVDGSSDPTNDALKVGAHLAHVNQATYRTDALVCSDCHGDRPSHQGGIEAGWSELATAGGTVIATPAAFDAAWEAGATPTCTNYCHGATLSGGTKPAPDWKLGYTSPGTEAACGTCHGKPPSLTAVDGEDHPQNTSCDDCHGALYSTMSVDRSTHVDGAVNAPAGCTACHGLLTGPPPSASVASGDPSAAPGYTALAADTHGNTAPSFVGVGAHGVHLRPSTSQSLMAAQPCATCHGQLPPDGDRHHADGTVLKSWGGAAIAQNVTPTWSNGTCTNYCHSDARPLGNAAASTSPVSWTDTTNVGCTSCHGNGTAGKALSAVHAKHLGAPYAFTCDECHANVVADNGSLTNASLHVDGNRSWQFSTTLRATTIDQSAGTYAGYTCSGTYCHSPGTKTTGFDAPVGPALSWNGGTQGGRCDDCHGGNAAATRKLATGSHTGHVNNSALAADIGCVRCHSATVSGDRALAANAPHLNGQREVSAVSWNGTTCAANACHSNGKGDYVSATWGSGTLDCNGCHGRTTTFGQPDYPNDGPDFLKANSHGNHIGSDPAICANCHQDTTTNGTDLSAAHANGQIDVRMNSAVVGAGAIYVPRSGSSSPTCQNLSGCHTETFPIKWGQTLSEAMCSECHLAAAGAGPQDVDDFDLQGAPSWIDRDDYNRAGHGAAAFNLPGQSGTSPGPAMTVSAGYEGCYYCHSPRDDIGSGQTSDHGDMAGNPYRLANLGWNGTGKNGACLVCHAPSTATGFDPDGGGTTFTSSKLAAKRIGAYHYGAGHASGGQGGAFCWDCHDPHGDYNYTTSRPVAYMIHLEPTREHSGPTGWGIPTATAPAVDFSSVLGENASGFDGGDYASAAGSNGVCQVCHSTTIYWRLDGTRKNHFAGGTRCTSCHAHNQPAVNAFKQVDNATCGGCHPSLPGAKHASHIAGTVSPTYGTTTVLSTDSVYSYDCGKCHPRAASSHYDDVGGTSGDPYRGAVSFDDGTGTYPAFVTPPPYSENGSGTPTMAFGWQNGTCGTTECHDPTPSYPVAAGSKVAVSWTMATPTLGCTGCHDDANGQASTFLPYAHAKHASNASLSYNYGCEKCHANTVASNATFATGLGKGKTQHADGDRNDVKFNATPRDQSTSGVFSNSPSGTCTNTYCHSGGVKTSATFDPTASPALAWNSGAASCRACHGWDAAAAPTIGVATGSLFQGSATHGPHVQNTLTGSYACAECHSSVVNSGNSPITSTALHVDGQKQVAFLTKNGQTSAAYVSPACNSNYCHSNGRDPGYSDAGRYVSNVTWGGAAIGCNGCHGDLAGGNTTGAPDYPNVPGNVLGANAHAKHTGPASSPYTDGATCQQCHVGYVNATGTAISGTKHTDGFRDVGILATYDSDTNAANNYVAGTKTCSNVKCHADGKATLGYKPVAWGDTVGCTGCHSNRGSDQGGVAADLSAKHGKHVNGGASAYAYTCDECHASTMQDNSSTVIGNAANHADSQRDWQFSSTSLSVSINQSGGSFSGGSTGTCTNTYCHSRGTSTTAFTAPFVDLAWGTGAGACDSCHGGNAAAGNKMGTTNHHGVHVNQLGYLGTNTACFRCHSTTVSSASDAALNATTGTTVHVDGTRNVSLVNSDGTTTSAGSYVQAGKSCSSMWCHSNGTEAPDFKPAIVWDGGATLANDCTGCHGSETGQPVGLWGAPNYAERVATNDDVRNSHSKHLSATLATAKTQCVDCHDATIDATGALKSGGTHLDRQVQITVGGKIGTYASTNELCSNISCHGGSGTTANWGGTISCLGCHSASDTVLSNGIPNGAGTYWTVNGHGSAAGGTFTSAQGGCDYCHDLGSGHTPADGTNPYRLRFSATTNALCLQCHATSDSGIAVNSAGTTLTAENSTKNVDATHNGTRHQTGEGGQLCWDCHDPHGVLTNIKMVKRQVQKTSDTYGVPGTLVNVQFTTQNCTAPAVGCNVEATNNPRQGVCQACHDPSKGTDATVGSVKYWRSDGNDAAASPSTHNSTKACSTCHAHKDKFAGKGGGWDCYGCHAGSQGTRRALGADFTKQSHHVRTNVGAFAANSTTEAAGRGTNRDCVVCHAEGQIVTTWSQDCPTGTTGLTAGSFPTTCTNPAFHANQIIDLRDVDVAAPPVDTAGTNTSFTYNKDRVALSAGAAGNWNSTNQAWREWTSGVDETGGETLPAKAGLDKFCLNCHDAGGASLINTFKVNSGSAPETTRTWADPFLDGATNITNSYDTVSRGAVVDIKSKVSCLDGTGAVNLGLCTSNGMTPGQPLQGVYSRHAIRGQSTSRYQTADLIPAAYWTNATWRDRSVMGCADCHSTDGANTTTGNAHGSNVEYLLKNNAGLAPTEVASETFADYVCYRCHAAVNYSTGSVHVPGMNNSDYADTRTATGWGGTAGSSGTRNTGNGNIMGMACANCHGGYGWGSIHGTSDSFRIKAGPSTRPAYRFMNGGSLRYYDPLGWTGGTGQCYTLEARASDTFEWGSCTAHDATGSGKTGTRDAPTGGRPISY